MSEVAKAILRETKLTELADRLENGAEADIWYDTTEFGDEHDMIDQIEDAQTAMKEAAVLLVSLKAILTQAEDKIVGLFNDIAPSSEGRFADKDPVVQAIREVLR